MSSGKKVIDTSPKILYENSRYSANGTVSADIDKCCTIIYNYTRNETGTKLTLAYSGSAGVMLVYNDGVKIDYWLLNDAQSPRAVINNGSNGVAFTLFNAHLATSYAYIVSTGEILFAGKNTPYYGYTNINDMPT